MRMNSGQKVIVCVALGAVVVVLGFAARAWWWEAPGSGWFNYAPNSGVVFSSDGADQGSIITQALLWIGLVGVWAATCLLVLRTRGAKPPTEPPRTPPET